MNVQTAFDAILFAVNLICLFGAFFFLSRWSIWSQREHIGVVAYTIFMIAAVTYSGVLLLVS